MLDVVPRPVASRVCAGAGTKPARWYALGALSWVAFSVGFSMVPDFGTSGSRMVMALAAGQFFGIAALWVTQTIRGN